MHVNVCKFAVDYCHPLVTWECLFMLIVPIIQDFSMFPYIRSMYYAKLGIVCITSTFSSYYTAHKIQAQMWKKCRPTGIILCTCMTHSCVRYHCIYVPEEILHYIVPVVIVQWSVTIAKLHMCCIC